MEDDTSREDIADGITLGAHVSDVDDFWGHKARGPASDEQVFFLVSVSGKAKVAYGSFPALVLLEHDVFWLEVAMDDAVPRQMGQSFQNVPDYLSSIVVLNLDATLNR